ncbi:MULTISPECIES: LacI family DNA-binding transcriptional regulator [Paenibacillus]|uniref:LacI family DNA-binding transcriptional regulator n=1 Tax=Paenibacillus TaxID=44249 RepID=UPI0004F62E23|nr:LacI family DNA-binding transcriptional regulator [Paenibacillus odorifer]AIQ74236.1 LacI family transcriptional regulator [Paenibacillus odorifer]MEC0133621.1 LacI family DNA-binding transcriptional regulator [Paenibacillus odorifer]MEC0224940.1 LacI family DNA-binding transcriptional regulator [Paenibacillus odorifer]OMC96505.1 LacI family transcriptional regulator [Paenibacillus odorifer]OMD15432.1 LacI family transcriptional regulator [Paenibacillus odorifer]
MYIASRKEVAELAGVSEATVSRVLNNVGPIKEETKERVLAAALKLGYTPSSLAQSFARRRSGNLGVVMPYLPKARLFSTYYFSEILSGIGSKAREEGYDLLMLFRNAEEPMDYSGLFKMRKIDACIVLGAKEEPGELASLRRLKEENHPFCLINQHFAGEAFHEVDADHVEGSWQAAKHLLEQGFTRIAFLNGPESYSNSRDRLTGYARALAEVNLSVDSSLLFEGNFSRKSGIIAAQEMLPLLDEIDAIMVANDRMAIGLQQGLQELGIPRDRLPAIVGYDDSEAAELTTPALSSVRVPFYELGELAAAQIIELLGNNLADIPAPAVQIKLPTELVIRASSKSINT